MSQGEPGTSLALIVNTLSDRGVQRDLRSMLPRTVDFEKFMTTAITAVQRAGDVIAQCDRQSVYNAIADAASKGLMPDGRQGALAPFRERVRTGRGPDDFRWITKCQFMIMPEGIIEVAARTGAQVYAASVYSNDSVRLWNDAEGQHFEHDYNPFGDRGELVGAVAVGRTRAGQVYVESVNADDIAKIKAVSKQKDSQGNMRGPWAQWEERMWQKSALHRLHKRMPGIAVEEDAEYVGERSYLKVAQQADPALQAPSAPPKPADVPRGTPAPHQGRPKALQRMVDTATGEVYEPGDGPPPGASASPEPQAPPADAPSPRPDSTVKRNKQQEDKF